MLTVLNRLYDGNEDVVEAQRVNTGKVFNPNARTNDEEWKLTVFAQLNDERAVSFDSGKVFVMNSNGKTVAVYDLPSYAEGPVTPLESTPK